METQTEVSTVWQRFRDAYAADLDMQEALDRRLRFTDRSAVAATVCDYARSCGFEVERDIVERFFADAAKHSAPEELNDEELEKVAGGVAPSGRRLVPSQTKVLLLG